MRGRGWGEIRRRENSKEKEISEMYRLMGYKENYERTISRNGGNNVAKHASFGTKIKSRRHTIAHATHVQWFARANPACGRNELGPCTND